MEPNPYDAPKEAERSAARVILGVIAIMAIIAIVDQLIVEYIRRTTPAPPQTVSPLP